MSEASLTIQATKNIGYVQPPTRAAWISYLEESPRSSDTFALSLHDIPDGSLPPAAEHEPFYDPLA